ncbi:MAG TPA: thiamine pyrophosphate-dependent enzyme [Gemmatimonadales bacterium]|nr:thiamine pyrophosphate-dependent enzyme [Gemmatimonadales bacterium]
MTVACSLLSCAYEDEDRALTIEDYAGAIPRWCPGCGDHAILTAVEKLLEAEQLPPERTVFVSGIGCSSRFPHYLKTYGFHGIHGRALPVATGIKLRRPDLHVFAVMGDGDCCSIGAAHWVHATRYNTHMVALLLDNAIYGLTKNQTSPTTPQGFPSNTQPKGTYLRALNPLTATLGVTNASFVAQTADWIPAHLYATLRAAYHHGGFAFVRILQRCPQYSDSLFTPAAREPGRNQILVHPNGITVPELDHVYRNRLEHDPSDLHRARELAEDASVFRLGLFYRDAAAPRYNEIRAVPQRTPAEKVELLDRELDRYAV